MARSRNIKPAFFVNEDLIELDFGTRLLFIGLWTLADREGRIGDRPKKIKMELFPADDINVDDALNKLSSFGFVTRYEVDGKRVIQVANFEKHQSPHGTEKDSVLPDSDGVYTVNERSKNGIITGNKNKITNNELANNVNITLSNVSPPCHNALIPDSFNMNHECGIMNVDSKQPENIQDSAEAGEIESKPEEKPHTQTREPQNYPDIENWKPPLATVNDKFRMAGQADTNQVKLNQELVQFRLHYSTKHLAESQLYGYLIAWFKRIKPDKSTTGTSLDCNTYWEKSRTPMPELTEQDRIYAAELNAEIARGEVL